MSKIDEIAALIQDVTSKIDEAAGGNTGAVQATEETAAAAEALGTNSLVEALHQVKEQLDVLTETLRGASQHASEVQALVLSLADGG